MWIVAFLATIVLNTELGLGVAVLYLLLTLAFRSNQESTTQLDAEGTFALLNRLNLLSEQLLHGFESDKQSRKMVIRLEGNISFLSKSLSDEIRNQTGDLLIDASGLGSIDFAGFDALKSELKKSRCERILVCTTKNQTIKIFTESGLNVSTTF